MIRQSLEFDDILDYLDTKIVSILNSLNNIGESAEPNLTVLWRKKLPENFKKFASKMSIKTHTLQFENDDIMRPIYGNDYAISCCVSALTLGHQTQFFGARINFVKVLLYALNGGRDEITGDLVIPGIDALEGEYLDAEEDDGLKYYEFLSDETYNSLEIDISQNVSFP